ncbi:uncharacterized protein K444DRAFT_617052 [Hyaloscypha bicolor E]|uniref:Uncharacterized protein n=1 Tax=Hyaloscypha bicolor E TaxID=1095630 RepID=A0A2J6SYW6_9HELO|nr:uncharacterized protein K444DRAFT_617052 [Hyaloscypha bicolor E]PMD55965.1 hypothetical protein K444DRAFT_617052 [Hyaloscypha bicolor E]
MTNPEQIPASQFEFILASAESLDDETKKASISGFSSTTTLGYDFLIFATSSRAKGDTPLKGVGSTEDIKATLHDFQARVVSNATREACRAPRKVGKMSLDITCYWFFSGG